MEAGAHDPRAVLARRAIELLVADERVERVELFGSLAGDPDIPDALSDIDLDVFVRDPATDLEVARAVPELVAPIGRIAACRTIHVGRGGYVVGVWFEDQPPFWHLDVRCRANRQVRDDELLEGDAWTVGFTTWMLSVKRLVRAFGFLGAYRGSIGAPPTDPPIPFPVVEDLRALLRHHADRTTAIPGQERFVALCRRVDTELLRSRSEYRRTVWRPPAVTVPPTRPPADDDRRAIADLLLDAYRGTIDDEGETDDDALAAADHSLAIVDRDASVVLTEDERIVALSFVITLDGRPYIDPVVTTAARKGRGLGSSVVAASLQRLHDRGLDEVGAVITDGNTPSERLFTALGFERIGPWPRLPSDLPSSPAP